MKQRRSVTCVGEALIDLVSTENNMTLVDAGGFVKAVGGEAANVAVGLARLGTRVYFVGKVGRDPFGRFLVRELRKEGVDTRGMRYDEKCRTRLAFVSLGRSGDRGFEFWERHPAGEQLRYSDVNVGRIARSTIVNIAPLLLKNDPARTSAFRIAREVRRLGSHVAFDANVRMALWNSPEEAKRTLLKMVGLSTILRLNEEEAKFLTGRRDLESAGRLLLSKGPHLVVITRGERGSYFQTSNCSGHVRGFKVKAVDTTGCGDGFFAAVLHWLAADSRPLDDFLADDFAAMCAYANAVGALTSLARGGAAAMPSSKEVESFLKNKRMKDVLTYKSNTERSVKHGTEKA
ncbi:MAG: carbohydrate kinase [Ignavibacteriae bacterium]|nr:carbohydrate kinase [Ignavibacteriota bacterium]